jgi:cytochrome c oxidase cbb3-type subunit 3
MENNNDSNLMNHDYDGIREYDNPLPNWWLWIFLLTIIFSFIYYLHYEISGVAKTQDQELLDQMQEISRVQNVNGAHKHAHQTEVSDETLAAALADTARLTSGQSIYQSKCAACHGDRAQGLIGPNLTDAFWIHGNGSPNAILAVINQGVPEKGMPQWESVLDEGSRVNLLSFVVSLKNSNPSNPKPPEGVEIQSEHSH